MRLPAVPCRGPLTGGLLRHAYASSSMLTEQASFPWTVLHASSRVQAGKFSGDGLDPFFFLFRCPLQSLGKGMHRCHLKLDKIPRAWIRQQQARSIMHRVHASCGGVRTLCIFPTRSLLIARRASRGKQTCAPRTVSIVPLGLLRLYTNVTAPLPHACTALCLFTPCY